MHKSAYAFSLLLRRYTTRSTFPERLRERERLRESNKKRERMKKGFPLEETTPTKASDEEKKKSNLLKLKPVTPVLSEEEKSAF